MNPRNVTEAGIERMVSVVLRTGVLVSGAVVLAGGVYFVMRHAGEVVNYHTFNGQPSTDRFVSQIFWGAIHLRARSIIQLGILLLIATPISRVAVSLIGFALARDRTYVIITAIVLAVLLFSLISGAVSG